MDPEQFQAMKTPASQGRGVVLARKKRPRVQKCRETRVDTSFTLNEESYFLEQ